MVFLIVALLGSSYYASADSMFDVDLDGIPPSFLPVYGEPHADSTWSHNQTSLRSQSFKWSHNLISSSSQSSNYLLHDYDPSHFSNLYDFPDVYHFSTQEKPFIDDALTIVKEQRLSGVVSVALLHRHFQLSANEMLVEVQAANQSDISVYDRNTEVAKNSLPYMFKVVFDDITSEAFLQPLEFVNFGNNAAAINRLNEDINAVLQNPTFLSMFYQHLSTHNFTNIFGITLNHRSNLKVEHSRHRGTTETSSVHERKLTVRPTVVVDELSNKEPIVLKEDDDCIGHIVTCTGGCNKDNAQLSATVAWSSNVEKYKKSPQLFANVAWSTYPGLGTVGEDECTHCSSHTGCSHGSSCYFHKSCYHSQATLHSTKSVAASPITATVAWSDETTDACVDHECDYHGYTYCANHSPQMAATVSWSGAGNDQECLRHPDQICIDHP